MSELIDIPSPGESLRHGMPGNPLVVVQHDWYGRLPGIDTYASALSRVGFRVVAPDLYNGVATQDAATADELMNQLDVATALALIDDEVLTARADGSHRFAVVGFSMGGWLGLLHAQGGATDAVVAYYATLAPSQHGVIPCPVQLHFAERDEWGEGEQPQEFIGRLKDHGTPVNDNTYLGTVHSFANGSMLEYFDAAESALAFARTASFLEDQLAD